MRKKSSDKCVNPKLGKFFKQCVVGELVKPGREKDLKAFEDHARKCKYCWNALIEHGHNVVGIPILKEILSKRRR